MNIERDLDRLLDAWLDDGPEILPDRALDAALEAVDRMPQRGSFGGAWRDLPMIGSASVRNLRPIAVLGAIALLVVVTATAIALFQPRIGGPPAVAPSSVLTLEDIQAIVLQPDEAPAGTAYDSDLSGPVNLSMMIRGAGELLDRWSALGLGDNWHSLFRGSDSQWATAAMLWPDGTAAGEALAAHLEVLPVQLDGEQPIVVQGLGDEGACFSYTSNLAFGDAGALCVFRVGNATFFIPGSGDSVEPAEVVRVARTIATRAANR